MIIETLSYLHVGSAEKRLKVSEDEVRQILNSRKQIDDGSIAEIKFEEKHLGFPITAGSPSIPASSIKGNIRSRIELSLTSKDGKSRSCFIRASPPMPMPKVGQHGWRHYEIWREVLAEDRRMCDHTDNRPVCLICDLFGTNGLSALINFSDFYGKGVNPEPLDLEYDNKVIAAPPHSRFCGSIDFFNLKPHELGLLFIGMGLKDSSRGRVVLLGRFKYRKSIANYKFGRICFQLENLKLSEFSKPIEVGSLMLHPGETINGKKLNDFVGMLFGEAMNFFREEIKIRDEVTVIEGLS